MLIMNGFCELLYSYFFFFKQKTAYEMRISDWSSDVCSSDLVGLGHEARLAVAGPAVGRGVVLEVLAADLEDLEQEVLLGGGQEIGRASCRERVCQYV